MPERAYGAISATTRYCAVYGHPVWHSASPAMQNSGIDALGLAWRYLAFEVCPDRLREAIAGARAMHFIGLNLTLPHKLLAVGLVDALDGSASRWGAVNTIRFEGRDEAGRWRPLREFTEDLPEKIRAHGFNTDADAIIQSLKEDLGFEGSGRRVLVLGAGGAGHVAALRLAAEGVSEMFLVNRTQSKADAVAGEIQSAAPAVKVTVGYPAGDIDLALNTTSLGLKQDDAMPFDEARFSLRQAAAVYDMVYRPAETPFLAAARAVGCRAANGLGMLLHQGAKALEIWSGLPAPVSVMRRALEESVYGT